MGFDGQAHISGSERYKILGICNDITLHLWTTMGFGVAAIGQHLRDSSGAEGIADWVLEAVAAIAHLLPLQVCYIISSLFPSR